ncbi:MAG: acetyl-CoA carboxylase biotin carboxyl carrier protein subunit [Bacteroidales bacterium]|nr:acetyl-CoA carboxylase biotin carboxyl carrier protein subunit [Bacteroidales bacterium]
MKLHPRRKSNPDEYIAVSQKDKKYKILNPFSEEIIINSKKTDIKIFESDDGFTYLLYKNKKYLVEITEKSQNKYTVMINGVSYSFTVESPISYMRKKYLDKQQVQCKIEKVNAPMPGKIIELLVEENAEIKEGEPIAILEAMKMQNEISSHVSGRVKKIHVRQNDSVAKGELIIEIER